MDEAEAHAIDAKYKTVRELLLASRTLMGHGGSAVAFAFPADSGLDDYVLRIRLPLRLEDYVQDLLLPLHLPFTSTEEAEDATRVLNEVLGQYFHPEEMNAVEHDQLENNTKAVTHAIIKKYTNSIDHLPISKRDQAYLDAFLEEIQDPARRLPLDHTFQEAYNPIPEFQVDLETTTALYTMPKLFIGTNAGQPLLRFGNWRLPDGIEILLKHKGKKLVDHIQYKSWAERNQKIFALAKELQSKTGKNPFVPMLKIGIIHHNEEYAPDFNLGNWFLNEQQNCFELIDQQHNENNGIISSEFSKSNLLDNLGRDRRGMPANENAIALDASITALEPMIIEANRIALEEINRGSKSKKETAAFAKPNKANTAYKPVFGRTCSTQAIRLDDPPHVLVERLRELKAFALSEQPAR